MKTVLTILEVSARVFWPSALALSFSIRASMVIPTKGLGHSPQSYYAKVSKIIRGFAKQLHLRSKPVLCQKKVFHFLLGE